MRYFLRSAIQGYTPAMANLGTLYEIGAATHADFRRAYAWVRTALSFGVPEVDHDETVSKLWMIAARLDPERIESAERLADVIVIRIVESCSREPPCLLEAKPRIARGQRGGVAVAQAANEIGLDVGLGEELAVDSGVVESGHGTAIQSERARSEYQIASL
jgi:TPR repeat protein